MSAKAQKLSAELADSLKRRLSPALAVVEAFDSDGYPLIKVGPQSAGSASALIKVRPQQWPLAKDILGLDSQIFSPSVIQLVLEANYAGASDNIADNLSLAQLAPIMGEVIMRGARVEFYQSANGNAVGPEDIVSGNLKYTWDPSLAHGMIANQ